MCMAFDTVAQLNAHLTVAAPDEAIVVGEAIVPYVPPPPPVMARGLEYYMDGRHMGRLYLDQVHQMCSWNSRLTGITTSWHGEWHAFPSGAMVCFFDFGGRET